MGIKIKIFFKLCLCLAEADGISSWAHCHTVAENKVTDTHRPSAVTLAYARQWLISFVIETC